MEHIENILPHRAPMLMVDRIVSLEEISCVALKNISFSEPCFAGHFPNQPVFPGVLIVEALAQTCSLWLRHRNPDVLPIFAEIQKSRFLKMVIPGDQLRMSAQYVKEEKGFFTFETTASVEDNVVCHATLIISQRPKKN